jgi:hypothetical protein
MLIGKNYPSPSLLSIAKGEATKALSPHLIYRQADTHQQYARHNGLNCTVVPALNRLRVKNVKNYKTLRRIFRYKDITI